MKEEIKILKEMNDKLNEKLKFAEKQCLEVNDELARKRTDFINVKTELEILRKGTLAGDKITDYTQSDFLDVISLVLSPASSSFVRLLDWLNGMEKIRSGEIWR